MPAFSKIGDHYGPTIVPFRSRGLVIQGSPTTFIDGQPVGRLGDKVRSHSGKISTIQAGSSTCFADGKPMSRIGDKTANIYILISGSSSTFDA